MKKFGIRLSAFVVALLSLVILGSFFHTQFVLSALPVPTPVSFSDNMSTTLSDILGLAPLYGAIMGAGLLIAFLIAIYVTKLAPSLRWLVYMVAGFVAVIAALLIMKAVFGLMPIAGARSMAGLLMQGVAGAVAGYVFTRINPAPSAHTA
ncbi:MAG: hypothetical protein ACJAXQ_000998 [Parvibaculaceae bacterium]|jgi:hypothetical protein|nr:hypothetical protein [Parvibaculaceae bacterium]